MAQKKYTKQEITEMADRCYRRCWNCERYEPCGNLGTGGVNLFQFAGSGCYEAHDLPWEHGHWCPFWGNKNHPDAKILRSLTWNDLAGIISAEPLNNSYTLRNNILAANPDIAKMVQYCDNSNESREQYFNKSENRALLHLDDCDVYCETLRRYRFSLVDSRALYPGANEWIRPMMICYDPQTYKSLVHKVDADDGFQISFACSPERNYILDSEIFYFDESTNQVIAEFRNKGETVAKYCMSVANIGR